MLYTVGTNLSFVLSVPILSFVLSVPSSSTEKIAKLSDDMRSNFYDSFLCVGISTKFKNPWTVPLAGNAFISSCHPNHTEVITEYGLGNWISEATVINVFFYITSPTELKLALRLKVPFGKSSIKVTLKETPVKHSQERIIEVEGSTYSVVPIGYYSINKMGYVNLELQGVCKSGNYFADVSDVVITCSDRIRCVADDFYFGRRGPSIHLSYHIPCDKDMSYFYNEIIVPSGQDVVGAYFCAAAFHGGYFGIQVNSSNERRILFSIWSTCDTDDPACIPSDYKVLLIRKGDNVHVGEFGNEGAGGQSYLRYNWKSESKYKFLVNATPRQSNRIGCEELHTKFSAWFWSPEEDRWIFIASFLRQMENVHLRCLYSFSENFLPETGHIVRAARFCNQWVRDNDGFWHEVSAAQFTGDDTSKRHRQDFAGGVVKNDFFLKNCGFFNESVELNQRFERCKNFVEPNIDFASLP